MEIVKQEQVQELISSFANKDVYIHLETTNGSYAGHFNEGILNAGAFIRNVVIKFEIGKIEGESPHRVGLKLPLGWVYAQGITHFTVDKHGRLLMAGLDSEGKLSVALHISETPFTY